MQDNKNKFFNTAGTHILTKALFLEVDRDDQGKILYSLKDEDTEGYPSLYRLYMELGDLTEYEFATTYFYNWNHWKLLCKAPWFIEHVARWREELDLKTKSEAIKRIKAEAKNTKGKNTFSANKILIDRAWEKSKPQKTSSSNRTAGRPTREEVLGELKREVSEARILEDDYQRVIGGSTR